MKRVIVIVLALLLSVTLCVMASTVDAQAPVSPPVDAELQTIGGVSPVSPIVPDIQGVVPMSPTPEPTESPSWYCWLGVCYEW